MLELTSSSLISILIDGVGVFTLLAFLYAAANALAIRLVLGPVQLGGQNTPIERRIILIVSNYINLV